LPPEDYDKIYFVIWNWNLEIIWDLYFGTWSLRTFHSYSQVEKREIKGTMVSNKAQDISPFIVMDVLEKAQELERGGEHIVHLEVGEPDFDTPECINEACYRAIREGKTHYTHSLGLIELREAIAEDYWKKYRVRFPPNKSLLPQGPLRPCFFSLLPCWNTATK